MPYLDSGKNLQQYMIRDRASGVCLFIVEAADEVTALQRAEQVVNAGLGSGKWTALTASKCMRREEGIPHFLDGFFSFK